MAAVTEPAGVAEQRVILRNVSWQTYERLLEEQQENAAARLNYDRGVLEIMILLLRHERIKHLLATLVELIAAQRGLDVEGVGSTTFRREDLARGFEPDAAFYLRHAARMRGREQVNLPSDPAPELVIEIDISHGSLDKLPVYAGLGVVEMWRYDGQRLRIYRLEDGRPGEVPASELLGGIDDEALNELITAGQTLSRGVWLAMIRRIAASR